jgi:enterochelin esterase-like enzyme
LLAVAFLVVGVAGAWSYWESYYQHRGFTPPPRVAHAAPGRLETIHFFSSALHRRAEYLAYLPAGYRPTRRYPVMYLLHGSPGRPQLFFDVSNVGVRLDNLVAEHELSPMILVALDGRIDGSQLSDSEWANTRSGDFESYVLEAVRDVDRRFATIDDRRARVIAGYSEGAYGALNIALHHLNVFGFVQVWSGYFTQPNPAGVFTGASRAVLYANSPFYYVHRLRQQLRRFPLNAFIYVGRRDPAWTLVAPMVRVLRAAGARARYAIYPGGHDWQLWNAHMNQMLVLAGRDVRASLALAPRFGPAQPLPAAAPARAHRSGPAVAPRQLSGFELLVGLLLALLSAAAINLGFLLQHRGLRFAPAVQGGRLGLARAVARNRSWLGGQALGWAGFAAQIAALSIAPLSLVQSFAAGGLVLSVPLAAGLFKHQISRRQRIAVLLVALGLAVLPLGLVIHSDRLDSGRLIVTACAFSVVALASASVSTAPAPGSRTGSPTPRSRPCR